MSILRRNVIKKTFYEDNYDEDVTKTLISLILYILYNNNIECEEMSDYIKTEIVDIYPKDDKCLIVTNPCLKSSFKKELRYNKLDSKTSKKKLKSIAETIVEKALNLKVYELL